MSAAFQLPFRGDIAISAAKLPIWVAKTQTLSFWLLLTVRQKKQVPSPEYLTTMTWLRWMRVIQENKIDRISRA